MGEQVLKGHHAPRQQRGAVLADNDDGHGHSEAGMAGLAAGGGVSGKPAAAVFARERCCCYGSTAAMAAGPARRMAIEP